jgi:hypothetical protein
MNGEGTMRQVAEIVISMLLVYGAYSFFTVAAQLFGRLLKFAKKRRSGPPPD